MGIATLNEPAVSTCKMSSSSLKTILPDVPTAVNRSEISAFIPPPMSNDDPLTTTSPVPFFGIM
jgi:hypothetical protein